MNEDPTILCSGRCDDFGELDPSGDYVRLNYHERHSFNGHEHGCKHGIVLSDAAAETLVAQLQAALAQKVAAPSAGHANSFLTKPALLSKQR